MKLALIGVGLIGGSLARALRAADRVDSITGFDSDSGAIAWAMEHKVIDRSAPTVGAAVHGADVIVIATPVGTFEVILGEVAQTLGSAAIITDVGSTKAGIIEIARSVLGDRIDRFVPGHPIAGGERNGVLYSDSALFRGKLFVSTPTVDCAPDAIATVESMWQAVGARVERMDAGDHDRIFAAVSHLPHLLAFALVAQIASEPDSDRKFDHAGAGFRDFTRIAAASPEMWRDVCLANGPAIAAALSEYRDNIDQLLVAIAAHDAAALEQIFSVASQARRRYAAILDGG